MSRHMRQAVALAYGKHLVPVVTAHADTSTTKPRPEGVQLVGSAGLLP